MRKTLVEQYRARLFSRSEPIYRGMRRVHNTGRARELEQRVTVQGMRYNLVLKVTAATTTTTTTIITARPLPPSALRATAIALGLRAPATWGASHTRRVTRPLGSAESSTAHGNLNERAESKARMCSVERRARDGLASTTTRVLLPLGSGPTASTMLPLRSLPPLDLSFSLLLTARASCSFSLHLFLRLSFFLSLIPPPCSLSFSLLLPCSFPSFLFSSCSLLSFFISFPPPRVISSRSAPLGRHSPATSLCFNLKVTRPPMLSRTPYVYIRETATAFLCRVTHFLIARQIPRRRCENIASTCYCLDPRCSP